MMLIKTFTGESIDISVCDPDTDQIVKISGIETFSTLSNCMEANPNKFQYLCLRILFPADEAIRIAKKPLSATQSIRILGLIGQSLTSHEHASSYRQIRKLVTN